jgi:GH18 family chitinase
VGGYYFNSAQLIARKTKLARSLGLAGVMIWEVGNGTVSRAVRAAREP